MTHLLFADLPASIPGWVPDVFTTAIKIFVVVKTSGTQPGMLAGRSAKRRKEFMRF